MTTDCHEILRFAANFRFYDRGMTSVSLDIVCLLGLCVASGELKTYLPFSKEQALATESNMRLVDPDGEPQKHRYMALSHALAQFFYPPEVPVMTCSPQDDIIQGLHVVVLGQTRVHHVLAGPAAASHL